MKEENSNLTCFVMTHDSFIKLKEGKEGTYATPVMLSDKHEMVRMCHVASYKLADHFTSRSHG